MANRKFLKMPQPGFFLTALAALLLCLLAGCQSYDPQRSVEAIADDYLAAMLERYPAWVTRLGLPGARHDALFDNSPAALQRWQKKEDSWLAELRLSAGATPVGSRDWVTRSMLLEELEASVGQRVCRKSLWETSTTTGWHTGLPFLFDQQPLETQALRAQALSRLRAVVGYIDTEIANLREGLQLGYSSPRVTVAAVPAQVRVLIQSDSPFYAMGRRVDDPEFQAAVEQIMQSSVSPALERFALFIEQEYLPAARTSLAIADHPNGAACYPAVVRAFATVAPEPREIHALGLQQITLLRAEMQTLLDAHFDGVPVQQFLRQINTDPRYTFQTEDQVLAYSKRALAGARAAMPRAFEQLPKAAVEIKPYPAFAASGVGEYQASSEDGSRPGVFFIAVRDPKTRPRANQQATLYHETYPGHHLQGALALELGDAVHPLARYLGNSGFLEGWALYAERLAQELQLYGSPLDTLGLLSDQAARAARLVVDTGLHVFGWTREQAVAYMLNNTGWSRTDIENDVNRYISWPGQANSYMLGMLEIRRLRTKAEQTLGAGFELRAFHSRLLENGAVTLPMLEQAIDHWITHDGAASAP
ncbi:MAG: DUF885 family protein [Pseudomonadales bacterium]